MKIAFDVDDTLIVPAIAMADEPHPYIGLSGAVPNYEVIEIYKWFQSQGNYMIIWSGGGIDYAKTWAEKLGLKPDEVIEKKANIVCKSKSICSGNECTEHDYDVDIAFDDCDVDLAKVNVKVKRINNSISRKDWNKHEPLSTNPTE